VLIIVFNRLNINDDSLFHEDWSIL